MKKMIAVLLVALIIGVTPAFAVQYGEITQTVDMTVRGRGADVAAASELAEVVVNENNTSTGQNNITTETSNTNNASVASENGQTTSIDVQVPDSVENSDSVTLTNDQSTGADTQYLNDSLDNYTVNVTVPQIDTSGIVMQSTDYSCGPAALATVLQNMGINSTEGELKVLAETNNETGTSMYGLVRAAKAKGVNAVGMRLSVDDLRTNMIVHVTIDGEGHYSVIRKISNESVYLADPSKGNIVLSREEFSAIFTGNVLVINGSLNQTAEQVNNTNTSTVQAENNQTLTAEEMQTVRGRVIKLLPAAFVATIKLAAKNAVSIAKREVGRIGKRAAIKNARSRVSGALRWLRGLPRPVRGALSGLITYLISNHPSQWCGWRAGKYAVGGAVTFTLFG